MKPMTSCLILFVGAALLLGCEKAAEPAAAQPKADAAKGFQEYPLGDDKEIAGLNVAAVYFQSVDMAPEGMGLAPAQSDLHLEADISALESNQLGFGAGEWIPFLTVKYSILKEGAAKPQEGTLMPMSASDGPHYGANLKLDGAGTYLVKFFIDNPEKNGYLVHTDKATGVPGRFWTEPLEVSWNFDWLPRQW